MFRLELDSVLTISARVQHLTPSKIAMLACKTAPADTQNEKHSFVGLQICAVGNVLFLLVSRGIAFCLFVCFKFAIFGT
jgi:hypothetical protein